MREICVYRLSDGICSDATETCASGAQGPLKIPFELFLSLLRRFEIRLPAQLRQVFCAFRYTRVPRSSMPATS